MFPHYSGAVVIYPVMRGQVRHPISTEISVWARIKHFNNTQKAAIPLSIYLFKSKFAAIY